MSAHVEVLIIGGGPTGLGAAWRLQELGKSDWLLIERSRVFGGLASSVVDDAGFTWDLGGHVIFSHYEYFEQLLDRLIPEWLEHIREAWVWTHDRFIPYPFQNNIWRLPDADLQLCLDGLRDVYKNNAAGTTSSARPTFQNLYDWILENFGKGLSDLFFLPYNNKVWAHDLKELTANWTDERVATVDFEHVLKNVMSKQDDVGWGPNALFRYPLKGGTGAIWRALADKLPGDKLLTGNAVKQVQSEQKTVVLEDGRCIKYDYLISTMPLDCLLRTLTDQTDLTKLAGQFIYSSSHVIGIGMKGKIPDSLKTKCWIYFPDPDIPFYRATALSNYSPFNVRHPGEEWSLMCEVSESKRKHVCTEQIVGDVEVGMRRTKMIGSDTEIASRWHRRLEYGYPTPFLKRDSLLAQIDPRLQALNIFSRGRFGAWKYEVSNQDHTLMQGVEAINHILFGEEERTYDKPREVNKSRR